MLDEADVVEISVNADQTVWVERFGADPVPWGTMDAGQTDRFIRWCATWSQASIMEDRPILSGRIPGTAHRIEALIAPVVEAPAFSIRRHRDAVMSLAQFLGPDKDPAADPTQAITALGTGINVSASTDPNVGTGVDASTDPSAGNDPGAGSGVDAPVDAEASAEIAHVIPVGSSRRIPVGSPRRILSEAIADRRNILIAGATGSGKTTLLNACLDELEKIAPRTRLITIEDTPEIRVPLNNTLGLRSSPEVSMDRLLVSTLRLAPDRIVVGEVREGAVLMTLIKAWDTGHPGGLTTLHANSAAEVLPRLRMLATEVIASDPTQRLMQSLDVIVFLRRGRSRPVVETIIALKRAPAPTGTASHSSGNCTEPGGPDVGSSGGPDVGSSGGPDVGSSGGPDVGSSGGPDVGERAMEVVYSHDET